MFKKSCLYFIFISLIISNWINAKDALQLETAYSFKEAYRSMESESLAHSFLLCSADKTHLDVELPSCELKPLSRRMKRKQNNTVGKAFGEIVSQAAKDILVLNKNLFAWNSFKVIAGIFPLYVAARMIDEKLQRCFYDPRFKKNINQPPAWCHDVAKVSIGVPLVVLGLNAFFSKDDDQRWSAQIMLLGMPFVIWTKKLVKKMKFDACLRPWHEKLTHGNQRSFGGFPSGHMAQALYMAVLYGSRFGPAYAIPLGGIAALIGTTFVACNRHYLSQIIAGGAFGTIYALAASKLVQKKLTDKVTLRMAVSDEGRPTFSARVKW